MCNQLDLTIPTLGQPTRPSPMNLSTVPDDNIADFTPPDATILFDPINDRSGPAFELAGPRELNYFDGPEVVAGIVTCGGLCPGLNNVIRGLVLQLWHNFRVRRIHGIRYGFRGLSPEGEPPLPLDCDAVRDIRFFHGNRTYRTIPQASPQTIAEGICHQTSLAGHDLNGALRAIRDTIPTPCALFVINFYYFSFHDLPLVSCILYKKHRKESLIQVKKA